MKKLLLFTMVLILVGCNSHRNSTVNKVSIPGPPTIVYKTVKDYFYNVPISLNEDGSIASYPDPKDLIVNGVYSYPTKLHKGYLLDNRGINTNVAFIKLTYEEYAALQKAPTPDELKEMIINDRPLSEMYNCGLKSAFNSIIDDLNEVIDSKWKASKALKEKYKKIY